MNTTTNEKCKKSYPKFLKNNSHCSHHHKYDDNHYRRQYLKSKQDDDNNNNNGNSKQQVLDDRIDERDSQNPLNVTDYVKEIYKYYREKEENNTTKININFKKLDHQPHITFLMRNILIDWLVEVHLKFH